MKLTHDFSSQLKLLRKQLQADFALISHVDGLDYQVLAADSDLDLISVGDKFETQNTYCNEVINKQAMVAYEHVGSVEQMINHPIYTTIQLESYIGVPLFIKGVVVGTLNFSGFNKKVPSYSDEERSQVDHLAREIEKTLTE